MPEAPVSASQRRRSVTPVFAYQFGALFRKNLSQQRRQKATNVVQLALPVATMVLVGVFNVLARSMFPEATFQVSQEPPIPLQTATLSASWDSRTVFHPREYLVSLGPGVSPRDVGHLGRNCSGSGLLGEFSRVRATIGQNLTLCLPWSEVTGRGLLAVDEIIATEKEFRNVLTAREERRFVPTEEHHFTQGVLAFEELSNASVRYVIMAEESATSIRTAVPQFYLQRAAVRTELIMAFLRRLAGVNVSIEGFARAMPVMDRGISFDVASNAFACFPHMWSFLLPVFAFTVVQEKEQRVREAMKIAGLKMSTYWLVNYLYCFVLYVLMAIALVVTALCFQLRLITQTAWFLQLLLYAGWGLAQVSFGFVLSTFFSKARTATVVSYLVMLFGIIASIVGNFVAWPIDWGDEAPLLYLLFPPFAFYRGVALIGLRCNAPYCPREFDPEWIKILVILFVSAPLMLLLAVYLDQVLPSDVGIKKSPFFPLRFLRKWARARFSGPKTPKDDLEANPSQPRVAFEAGSADEDVLAEQRDVETGEPGSAVVVVKNLRKVYHGGRRGPKTAVDGISFLLPKNQCFGLLGPNGSGKTTTISMLTGMFSPTSGEATVMGFDIRTQMDEVHKVLGVCPQFDTVWNDLTPYETLLFYARLRGIPGKDAPACAKQTLKAINLWAEGKGGPQDRLVRDLSGGMRRRVSVAIALIGDPDVVFLDEPSTGLDPQSRRELWDVITKAQVGKCVVLTTHSMEEADALCQRIAIIGNGKLRCIGTNSHLKQKFGGGYVVKVAHSKEDAERAEHFVRSIVPSVQPVECVGSLSSYRFLSGGARLSDVFRQLATSHASAGITDWSVGQATLDEVFLNVVKDVEQTPSPDAAR